MPIFDYHCLDCNATYDIFHKTREMVEDIVCPKCKSTRSKKLMSVSMVSVGIKSEVNRSGSSGNCCGGACGLN